LYLTNFKAESVYQQVHGVFKVNVMLETKEYGNVAM